MGLIRKLLGQSERADAVINWVERIVKWALYVLGFTGTSGLFAWAASVTEALKQFAPMSWVLAGALGAALFVGGAVAFAWVRKMLASTRHLNRLGRPMFAIDPFQKVYEKKRFSPASIAHPVMSTIKDRTFVDCEIGLGAVLFSGCAFRGGASVANCDMVSIDQGLDVNEFHNLVIFENCVFQSCSFFNLILLIHDRDTFEKAMNPKPRWLNSPSVPKEGADVARQTPKP